MPKKPTRSTYSSRKPAQSGVPETLKMEVTRKANELIETVLKPQHIQPPPENPQFNYIVDIYGKWYHNYFYLCATYACPGPNATTSSFEAKMARLEYAGGGRFDLAFMRHTGQWVTIEYGLSVDECLAAIRDDPFFFP
jgi:hypothetical protein